MLFVPVAVFDKVIPIDVDIQHNTNKTWTMIVEHAVSCAHEPISMMTSWLLANARGGHRGWVDIVRREPSSAGCQRIIGHAGYRFRDPEEGMNFREMVEQLRKESEI